MRASGTQCMLVSLSLLLSLYLHINICLFMYETVMTKFRNIYPDCLLVMASNMIIKFVIGRRAFIVFTLMVH